MTEEKKADALSKKDKLKLIDGLAKKRPVLSIDKYAHNSGAIPSGSLSLDLALGVGGYPRGTIIDIFGPESSGKSLISLMAISQVQKMGGVAMILDAERSYSKSDKWLRTNGVNPEELRFIPQDDDGAEKAMETIYQICKAQAADLIVVDSVPALAPKKALMQGLDEGATMSLRARMMSEALNKLMGVVDDSRAVLMFINQMRAKIGGYNPYGPSEDATGGYALKFFSSIRMGISRVAKSTVLENKIPVGHRARVRLIKNKVARPYLTAEFGIDYRKGTDPVTEIADVLISSGLAKKAGAWIEYHGQKCHGSDELANMLKDEKLRTGAIAEIKKHMENITEFGTTEVEDEAPEAED